MRSTQSILALGIALTIAGCAKAPQTEISEAKHALEQAQNAHAPDYAPEAWNAAKDAEAKLDAELAAQEQNWALVRKYDQARDYAKLAKEQADLAAQQAVTGRDQAKADAEALLSQAREESKNASAALAAAPRGKGTEADLASLKTDNDGIESMLEETQRMIDSGDYLGAKTKAQAALDAAKRIETEIDEAKSRRRTT
jgi:hypothetical protein